MPYLVISQIYSDHLGAGNDISITVSSSSSTSASDNVNTINGTRLQTNLEGASRFLSQSSLGASYEEIEYVQQIGIEDWLEEQFAIPPVSLWQEFQDFKTWTLTLLSNATPQTQLIDIVRGPIFNQMMNGTDVLRAKVAFAYNQIFVVNLPDLISNHQAAHYDIFYQHTYGNFRDILEEVTYSGAMGFYLTYLNNDKADPATGKTADENFAREIMQLFTIGLVMLNNDGSPQLDADGVVIPTYNIQDIQELAKVFTGLGGSNGYNRWLGAHTAPERMEMYQANHDTGTKVFLNGVVIPANQPGDEDIAMALDALFNHPNVGPFIGIRMIQNLVKSNPTPQYVNRVATVFNDNGQGVRGDMRAVIKAILTDPEAIDCEWISDPQNGKLIQPYERFTMLSRGFDIDSPSGLFIPKELGKSSEQHLLRAPSVFNYFTPFFAEQSVIEPLGLVSPEFQILSATTAMEYINASENSAKIRPFNNWTREGYDNRFFDRNFNDSPFLDLSDEIALIQNDFSGLSAAIDRIDLIMCRGQLSATTKQIIMNNILANQQNSSFYTPETAVDDILYFIMISPDFLIQK